MNISHFLYQLHTWQQRIDDLQRRAGDSLPEQQAFLGEAFDELAAALEELQTAGEALQWQHEALLAAHQRYQELFDFAPDGYLVTDRSGVIQEANGTAAALLQVSQDSLVGMSLLLFIAVSDQHRFFTHLSRRESQRQELEIHLQRHGGAVFPAAVTMATIHDAQHKLVGVRWLLRDITACKHVEEALREQEERLRLALRAAQLGIWDWNLCTGAISWSETLAAIHGLPAETSGGTYEMYLAHVHAEDRPMVTQAIARTLEGGKDYQIHYRIVGPDDCVRWIEGRGQIFHDETGKPVRMLGVCMEITDRREAEEQPKASGHEQETLLSLRRAVSRRQGRWTRDGVNGKGSSDRADRHRPPNLSGGEHRLR